jgi:hypothetical protein
MTMRAGLFGVSIKLLPGLVGGVVLFLAGPSAYAARLLQIQVERGGQVVLETQFTDNGESDPAVVWDYLRRATLKPVGFIAPDPADPLRATLTVDIRVAILHVAEPVGGRTQARVQELHLVRVTPQDEGWQLAPDEVTRTAQAAGIGSESNWMPLVIACGLAGIVVGVMAAWFVANRLRVPPQAAYPVAELIPEDYAQDALPEELPDEPGPVERHPEPHR